MLKKRGKTTPLLAEKLISIALDPKVRGYTAVQAISEIFKIIQSGVIDKENKIEMKRQGISICNEKYSINNIFN